MMYLRFLGLNADNAIFESHSRYFRNALVRANCTSVQNGISMDISFLERFFRNLILDEKNLLNNRYLHIRCKDAPKCNEEEKSCTLEEKKLLGLIREKSGATQAELSDQLGRSVRTASLTKKGLIRRVGGKRFGHWAVDR